MRTTILTSLLLLASSLPAITLTYDPVTQDVPLGNTATVNVMASGLALNQVIGAFDLTVQWNPALLSLNSGTFSAALGSTITDVVPGAGQINLASVSLEDPAALALLQSPEPFALFSLTFNTLAVGTSPLTFAGSPFIISDGEGNTVTGVIADTGSITITDGGSGVPEPSTWALLATGLLAVAGARRRRQ